MQTERKSEELLEYLAHACGCAYLSDLRGLRLPAARVQAVLGAAARGAYPCAQWREAAEYLAGQPAGALDERDARAYIAQALTEQ